MISLWFALSGSALAQPASLPSNPDLDLTVVTAGGGALGAYLGGNHYLLARVVDQAKGVHRPVFVGASAGALLSMIGALDACGRRPATAKPQDSLYWATFVDVGLQELTNPPADTPLAVFQRVGFQDAENAVEKAWRCEEPGDCPDARACTVRLGATVTRAWATSVTLFGDENLTLPRSLEPVLLEFTGEPAHAMSARNIIVNKDLPQVLLPVEEEPFDAVRDLLHASSAFPAAFAPVKVDHCLYQPDNEVESCAVKEIKSSTMIDGGLFDNEPLGLAIRARPHRDASDVQHRLLLLNSTITDYGNGEHEPPLNSVLDYAGILSQQIGPARKGALWNALVDGDTTELREELVVSAANLPPTSDVFSGFIEKDFRQFDFFLGMFELADTLVEMDIPAIGQALREVEEEQRDNPAWGPYFCLTETLPGHGTRSGSNACSGQELQNFRILLQVSLDRRRCADPDAAMAVEVPEVRRIHEEDRCQNKNETSLGHVLRLLHHYGFEFTDLGLGTQHSGQAPRVLSYRLGDMVRRFARRQPALQRGVTRRAGRLGIPALLGYRPARHTVHLVGGLAVELGYSVGIPWDAVQWLRVVAAAEFDGVPTRFDRDVGPFALSPRGGLELEIPKLSGAVFQFRVGGRIGYLWRLSPPADEGFQTGLAGDAYVAVSALSALRLQLSVRKSPNIWTLRPGLGLHFDIW